jgi:septum formation protein
MRTPDFIYLASASPRRAQLLDQLGVAHRLLLADADEDAEQLEAERPGELPADYVRRVTRAKLAAAQQRLARHGLPAAPILAADTTVALGRRILGKPRDDAAAAAILGLLSGRSHRVLTAVAVGTAQAAWLEVSLSHVRLAELSARSIALYVASGEPRGKAGAYAIQGRIAAWIEAIEGSYTGIMGLPLYETTRLLLRAGVRLDL